MGPYYYSQKYSMDSSFDYSDIHQYYTHIECISIQKKKSKTSCAHTCLLGNKQTNKQKKNHGPNLFFKIIIISFFSTKKKKGKRDDGHPVFFSLVLNLIYVCVCAYDDV